jgi:predicted ATPase
LESATWLWDNQPETFPNGIFFVPFATLASTDQVLAMIIKTMSFKSKPNLDDLDTLKENFGDKRLLLLLDNFEHLLEQSELLGELLAVVPGLRLLVTSQAPLHLYGEQEYPLSPLPLPEPGAMPQPAELLNIASVHLFIDRLQAVQPQFRLTSENGHYVIEICRCLDGMPLALELAAARGNRFSPAAILTQLTQRLRFLTSQARNRPSRHQTLRATIDWSYNLLTSAEQQLFVGTALFAGPFTAEAAQAVFGQKSTGNNSKEPEQVIPAADVPDLLFALAERGMLRALLVGNTEEHAFRMLQTLREYGLEKLTQLETGGFYREQFVNYYFDLAKRAGAGLQGPE